jgi:hypothetical protein
MSKTPETDAARMFGYDCSSGVCVMLSDSDYEKNGAGNVVFAEVAEKLEIERNKARLERDAIKSCIEQGLDFYQVHGESVSAFALKNLLQNINERLNGLTIN